MASGLEFSFISLQIGFGVIYRESLSSLVKFRPFWKFIWFSLCGLLGCAEFVFLTDFSSGFLDNLFVVRLKPS